MKREQASRRLFLGGAAAFLGNLFFGLLRKASGSTAKSRAGSPVTIPAGQPVAPITVVSTNETQMENEESVLITIHASGRYAIGSYR